MGRYGAPAGHAMQSEARRMFQELTAGGETSADAIREIARVLGVQPRMVTAVVMGGMLR